MSFRKFKVTNQISDNISLILKIFIMTGCGMTVFLLKRDMDYFTINVENKHLNILSKKILKLISNIDNMKSLIII